MALSDFKGTTYNILEKVVFANKPRPLSSVFFKPYNSSPLNMIGRTTSIGTDLIVLEGCATLLVLLAGCVFLKSIGNLIIGNIAGAKRDISGTGAILLFSAISAVSGILSPIINLVDLIGGGVHTLIHNEEQASHKAI